MSTIFYRKFGNGYPVILIHGFCETHEIWNGFAEALAKKCEVFSIDLPGFGESPLPSTPFSIDDVGVEIFKWIFDKKINKPVVIGHSLGGYVTLALAKMHPENFAGIGLFQSTAYPDSEEKKSNRNKVIEFVKAHGVDLYIDTYVPGLFLDKKHPAIPLVDKIARKTSKESLWGYAAAMRDRPSSIDFIKNYQKPMLLLGADQDVIIPATVTQELGRLAPRSIVHLLKDTGHMGMYESPEESVKAVEKFALKVAGMVKS